MLCLKNDLMSKALWRCVYIEWNSQKHKQSQCCEYIQLCARLIQCPCYSHLCIDPRPNPYKPPDLYSKHRLEYMRGAHEGWQY